MKNTSQYVTVNKEAEKSDLSPLVGKSLRVKKEGKRKTVCHLFGTTISIENKYLSK